jgi:quinoprotein glucose dehydrogenase
LRSWRVFVPAVCTAMTGVPTALMPLPRNTSLSIRLARSNVRQLQNAWTWLSPDNDTVLENQRQQNFRATPGAFKVTPIAINGILYTSTSFGRVVAIDGATGLEIWKFDTRSWEAGRPANLGYNHRGVSYWSDGSSARIFMPSNDSWLWSLDAATGLPDPEFGDQGRE